MTRPSDEHRDDPVVTAIERVLKSERDGVEVLRRRADGARQMLAEARSQSGAITRRAESCATQLHAGYLQKIRVEIQNLTDAAAAQLGNGDDTRDDDDETLAQAVHRVAATLTGGP
jgi:vacuolar-type H+-ATPase subunit H